MTFPEFLPWLAIVSLVLALVPAGLTLANLAFYRRLPRPKTIASPVTFSVLIPARNEERAITPALQSLLACPDPGLEVLVLDDHSTDATARLVQKVADRDPRVRLLASRALPEGWCGKQHACWQLAQSARGEVLVFIDADVRLMPDAFPRLARLLREHPDWHLLSGVPRQVTGGWLERMLIPLIHFILLGFLPMAAARFLRSSALAAGCGQLFIARRQAYFACDGHRSIRESLHDGLRLPRSFRRHGFMTALFDATDVATCRMYDSPAEVWRGLGKNATEGMASPAAILPWTFLLLGGQVLPWLLLALGDSIPHDARVASMVAAALGLMTRLVTALRFRQSLVGAILHPVGVTALVAIQWEALLRKWLGRPMEWRGRRYAHGVSVPTASPHQP